MLRNGQVFGAINNVFYVEPAGGADEPAPSYGVTLDRPWKTIRYATEQVQAGAIRYNAKNLLERNRSFIQDEVIEYIEATYSDTATATTAATDAIYYNRYKLACCWRNRS